MSFTRNWEWVLQCGWNPEEAVDFLGIWGRVCRQYPYPVTVNHTAGFGRKCFFSSSAGSGWEGLDIEPFAGI